MSMATLREHLHRHGWLLAVLGGCIAMCLLLGTSENVSDSTDSRISRVLSAMEGAGQVEVAVVYDGDAVPCGAVVVAEGASSVAIRLQLESAVSTLLGLDPGDVAVYPRQGGAP